MKKVNYGHGAILEELATAINGNISNAKNNAIADCSMSEKAIAYAFEELESDVRPEIKAHLDNCRYCAELVQDVRAAAEEPRARQEIPIDVLPAVTEAINSSKRHPWRKWIRMPDFSLSSIYPKLIGAFATACLVLVIVEYSMQDPRPSGRYQQKIDQNSPIARKMKKAPKNKLAENQIKTPSNDNYSLNTITIKERNFIDPFKPLIGDGSTPSSVRKKRIKRVPLTPLEKLDFSQLKLVGIVLSANGNRAMVEDASGKGYVLQVGTYVGRSSGIVTKILKEKVIIEEEIVNVHGKVVVQIRELKLNKPQ
jgi:Tfp pilus assembly protein PilP